MTGYCWRPRPRRGPAIAWSTLQAPGSALAGWRIAARVSDLTATAGGDGPAARSFGHGEHAAQSAGALRRSVALDATASARALRGCGPKTKRRAAGHDEPAVQRSAGSGSRPTQAAHEMAMFECLAAGRKTAGRLLAANGALTLIWRADGLAEVLAALGSGFGRITVCRSTRARKPPLSAASCSARSGQPGPVRPSAGIDSQ